MEFLFDLYARLFARRFLFKFNKFLFYLSIRGLGVMNYKTERLSGEYNFIRSLKNLLDDKVITIFDVGANQGDYSMALNKLFPNAIIHSFEPHPKTYAKLVECVNNAFFTHNLGVGELNTEIKLYDYATTNESGSQHASIFQGVIEEIHHNTAQSYDIRLITLDKFVKDNGITKIDLLKIDTEGNELGVLKGASECLKNQIIDIIHFEFNDMNVVSRVYMKDFFDILCNYTLYRMLPDGLVPLSYFPLACEIFAYQNIVAIKKT